MGNYLDKRLKFHTASRVGIETNQSLAGAMNVDGHIVTTAKVWAAPVNEFPVNSVALNTSTDVIATTEDLVAIFTNNRTESDKITKTALHNGFVWRNSDYPAVELYDAVEMSGVSFSDGTESNATYQAYEILGADGLRVTDWVPPTAVIDAATGSPVAGFSGIAEAKDSTGAWTILQKSTKGDYAWALAKGNWEFVCISGMLTFDPAYTPTSATMGYTAVRYTGFKYIGAYLDAALEDLEEKVSVTVGGSVTALESKVNKEITDREAADTTLDGKITAEAARATGAESALDERLTAVEGKATDNTAAISAEAARATAAEEALDGRLDVIEGSGEGSVAKALADAKDYTDDKIAALGTPVKACGNWDTATNGAITEYDANAEGSIVKAGDLYYVAESVSYTNDAGEAASVDVVAEYIFKEVENEGVKSLVVEKVGSDINPANFASVNFVKAQVAAEKTRAEGIEGGLNTRLTTAEGAITTLNGEANVTGSVKAQVKAEADRAAAAEEALAGRLDTAEGKLTTLEGDSTVAGSVDAKVKAEADRAAAAESALGERLTAVEGIANDVADDIAAAVKAEADRATAAEGALDTKVTGNSTAIAANASAITAEETRAKAAEKANADAISAMDTAYKAADSALDERVTDVEADVEVLKGSGEGSVAKALADAKDYTDTEVGTEKSRAEGVESGLNTRLTTAEGNISAMDTAYKAADSALDTRLTTAEGAITTLNGEANVTGSVKAQVKAEADRAAAEEARIAGLVTAEETRAKAAEKANADAISAMDTAYKAADSALDTRLTTAEATLANLDSVNSRSNSTIEVTEANTAVTYNFSTTKLLTVNIAAEASAIINFNNFGIGDSALLYVNGNSSQYTINGVEPISLLNGLIDSFESGVFRISRVADSEYTIELVSFAEVEEEVVEG